MWFSIPPQHILWPRYPLLRPRCCLPRKHCIQAPPSPSSCPFDHTRAPNVGKQPLFPIEWICVLFDKQTGNSLMLFSLGHSVHSNCNVKKVSLFGAPSRREGGVGKVKDIAGVHGLINMLIQVSENHNIEQQSYFLIHGIDSWRRGVCQLLLASTNLKPYLVPHFPNGEKLIGFPLLVGNNNIARTLLLFFKKKKGKRDACNKGCCPEPSKFSPWSKAVP